MSQNDKISIEYPYQAKDEIEEIFIQGGPRKVSHYQVS